MVNALNHVFTLKTVNSKKNVSKSYKCEVEMMLTAMSKPY